MPSPIQAVGFVVIATLIFQVTSASFYSNGSSTAGLVSIFPLIYTIVFYSHFVRKLVFDDSHGSLSTPRWLVPLQELWSRVAQVEVILGRDSEWYACFHRRYSTFYLFSAFVFCVCREANFEKQEPKSSFFL